MVFQSLNKRTISNLQASKLNDEGLSTKTSDAQVMKYFFLYLLKQ